MHISLIDLFSAKFSGNCHKGEKVVFFIRCLVCNEVLMLFSDFVPLAVIFKNIAAKSRFTVVFCYSCRCHCVCGLDISVSVVDRNDLDVVDFCHWFSFLLNVK